jgi:protein subunit release factor A
METVILEIRAGEGGQDAKLWVEDQMHIYVRHAGRRGL